MKNIIKHSVVWVVLFTTLQSHAVEIPMYGGLNENKTKVLTFLNVKKGNQISVKNIQGNTLYKETIKNAEDFVDRFNLTFLPDGEYVIELEKDLETLVVPVEIVSNKAVFKTKSTYVVSRKKSKTMKKETPIELEKGIQKRTSSFKGGNFIEYYNLNK